MYLKSQLKYGIDRTGLLFCINVAKQCIQYFKQSTSQKL